MMTILLPEVFDVADQFRIKEVYVQAKLKWSDGAGLRVAMPIDWQFEERNAKQTVISAKVTFGLCQDRLTLMFCDSGRRREKLGVLMLEIWRGSGPHSAPPPHALP
jgi:hypothetical protein